MTVISSYLISICFPVLVFTMYIAWLSKISVLSKPLSLLLGRNLSSAGPLSGEQQRAHKAATCAFWPALPLPRDRRRPRQPGSAFFSPMYTCFRASKMGPRSEIRILGICFSPNPILDLPCWCRCRLLLGLEESSPPPEVHSSHYVVQRLRLNAWCSVLFGGLQLLIQIQQEGGLLWSSIPDSSTDFELGICRRGS